MYVFVSNVVSGSLTVSLAFAPCGAIPGVGIGIASTWGRPQHACRADTSSSFVNVLVQRSYELTLACLWNSIFPIVLSLGNYSVPGFLGLEPYPVLALGTPQQAGAGSGAAHRGVVPSDLFLPIGS